MLPAGSGSGSGDYGSGSGSGDYGSGYDDCNLSQCFLEYDVQYKVELADMKNLNADDADKKQSSMEECRTFCRYSRLKIFAVGETKLSVLFSP